MPKRRRYRRTLSGLILIGVVAAVPLLSAQPHPNDFVLALTYGGLEVCLIDGPVVEKLATRTAVDCGAANRCPMEAAEPVAQCPASVCECTGCDEVAPPCAEARGCCVQLRISQQPMFHLALDSPVDRCGSLDVIASADEFAETLRHQPPVPPPRSC